MHNKSFKFIDLFAGIGGLRMGFEAMGGECVFTSEWNKYSQITYRKNFPDDKHQIAGDIREINEEDIPQFDLLLAGFPCQPFSIAGVSKKKSLGRDHGFLDKTQGTLFFDIARILNYHKPSAFVLENVKNLLSHDKGNTFKVIKETLENIGYNIHYKIIDAKSFLPQHRERIFIVGFKDNVNFTWDGILDSAPTEQKKMNSVLHPEDGSESVESPYTEGVNTTVAKKYYLSDKMWNFLQAYAAKQKNKGNGFGYGIVGPNDTCRTLLARYYKDGSEILVENVNGNPRRLTPRECSRLMGFDSDSKNFIIPVSDTQAYRQFGNAVAVPVAKAVATLVVPKIVKRINNEN